MLHILELNFPYLLRGAGVTILLSAACIVLASGMGLVAAIGRTFGAAPFRLLALAYLYLMRGTPLLVMIIAVYYVLPYSGLELDTTTGGVLVVSLYFGAYMSEVFRAHCCRCRRHNGMPGGRWACTVRVC